MKVVAVLMAGGRSERMRVHAGAKHKALAQIAGVTLIERNLRALIASGFREIIVTLGTEEPELERVVHHELVRLARSHNVTLTPIVEHKRLGNIGFVGTIGAEIDAVVVSYVDNLTTLDLRALFEHHISVGADLTIAVHREPFPIPFGVLEVNDGRVSGYREKPTLHLPISSGTCVVGVRPRALVPPKTRLEARDLFELVQRSGLHVAAFEHDAPWVDVNDYAALARAEALVTEHPSFAVAR